MRRRRNGPSCSPRGCDSSGPDAIRVAPGAGEKKIDREDRKIAKERVEEKKSLLWPFGVPFVSTPFDLAARPYETGDRTEDRMSSRSQRDLPPSTSFGTGSESGKSREEEPM